MAFFFRLPGAQYFGNNYFTEIEDEIGQHLRNIVDENMDIIIPQKKLSTQIEFFFLENVFSLQHDDNKQNIDSAPRLPTNSIISQPMELE